MSNDLPHTASPGSDQKELHVLSPIASNYGTPSSNLATRPTTLDGLRVGLLWNGKPNGDAALRTVGDLLAETSPKTSITFYSGKIACAAELLDQIAEECDVVVACTADCGSCTSWITHDCIQLERRGVPTVIIASAGFEDNIEASSDAFGLKGVAYVVVPLVYNNIRESQAQAQTRPVFPEVLQALTTAGSDDDVEDTPAAVPAAQVYAAGIDGIEQFNQDYLDRDWGDGYPLSPPTPGRVAELVEVTGSNPDDVLCVLPPGNGHATIGSVAVNAAMAGVRPAEMPVVLTALRAIANLKMPMGRIALMSTSAQAPLFLVNGPITESLGINGGRCCLGPGKQNAVNIRIGRAALLALKNIGRWYPGVMDLDTIGSARKFNLLLAENEPESPWEPYHVTQGYNAEDNVVSVFMTSGDWDVAFQGHVDEQQLARALAAKFAGAVQSTYVHNFMVDETEDGRLVLLSPQHALPLQEGGFSKQDYMEFLHERVREPVARMIEPLWKLHADGRVKDQWKWLFELGPDEAASKTLPLLDRPELWNLVVAGSVRAKDLVLPLMSLPSSAAVDTRSESASLEPSHQMR